ncbi:MAG: autotransporter assembly complex protein TamA [Shimia sp.]
MNSIKRLAGGAALALIGHAAWAVDVSFNVAGDVFAEELEEAALGAQLPDDATGRDTLAAALSDYRRIVETLYARGHYSSVVSIELDGREAAQLPLVGIPAQFNTIVYRIDPGPAFTLRTAEITPLAEGTELPEGFRPGAPAEAEVVKDAVAAGVEGWRQQGHPKVRLAGQELVADHPNAALDVQARLAPGPDAVFGELILTGDSTVRANRIRQIAGFPTGKRFDPDELDLVASRLRRAGPFSAVALEEAETLGPDDTLDVILTLDEFAPRRVGFGAELSTLEGVTLSAFWLHRNLLGGAERFRVDGEVSQLGSDLGTDYELGFRIERPADLGTDYDIFALGRIEVLDEPSFESRSAQLGIGVERIVNEDLQGDFTILYEYDETEDAFGTREFQLVSFALNATLDKRDIRLNPTRGFYVQAGLTPWLGLDDTESGIKGELDLRGFYPIGERVVLAARGQIGAIGGAELDEVRPKDLFFSGGGGTVRGQPYQSLGVGSTGGRSFYGLSLEGRLEIRENIGAVAFVDYGYVGPETFFDGSGDDHAGAGIGVRYLTGFGPIRADIALPVSGGTGDGVQIYVGIGQAF